MKVNPMRRRPIFFKSTTCHPVATALPRQTSSWPSALDLKMWMRWYLLKIITVWRCTVLLFMESFSFRMHLLEKIFLTDLLLGYHSYDDSKKVNFRRGLHLILNSHKNDDVYVAIRFDSVSDDRQNTGINQWGRVNNVYYHLSGPKY